MSNLLALCAEIEEKQQRRNGIMEECNEAKLSGLTFGQAIEALKAGRKVARAGWNGKGMYLWMKPRFTIKPEMCSDPMLKQAVIDNGGELLGLPSISMFTHDATGRKAVLSGWLASQSDMLLSDWQIIG